jgi:predicted phage terminase large subunit-like protein
MWKLMKNTNERILIYSDATSKAQGFLSGIKNFLLGKEGRFREFFGEWETDSKGGKWNESQILIDCRTKSFIEPTIETAGIETSLVGRHYDIILFDDIVSDKNVTTKEQMDKVADCYKKALSLLKPGGVIIITGTRWHFGDLYGRIIAENKEKQNFKIFHRNADTKENDKLIFSDIGLNEEFLRNQKAEQGSYIFSCIYNNEPSDPETAVFRIKDFSFYGDIKPDDLYITCTCDPAGKGDDFTGLTVVGTDYKMNIYILDAVSKHLQPSEIIEEIIRLSYKWKFGMFGLEENFFRGMLKVELDRRIEEERQNPDFKLFGYTEFKASSRAGEGKNNRIMGLQPFHERGALLFPGNSVELLNGAFSDLAYQMIQFPHSAHDDVLDSLAYHLPLIRKGGVAQKKDPPKHTPAWLELHAYRQQIKENSRLPRRFRKNINDVMAFN